jgi:DNA-binding CsgD family transcriptional regulator
MREGVPQREGKRMNKKNTGLYSRAESLKRPSVIGELHVSDNHYWIILIEAEGGKGIVSSNAPLHSEFCRFEVQGQLCAIVEDGLMPSQDLKDPDPIELLTERELQIARLVALGRLNKQIAHQLHISEWTVATHLRRIFAKLGVDTRAAMVYRCAFLIGEQPAQASIVDPKNWTTGLR